LFYPTVGDVKKAHESAQEAASNIGERIYLIRPIFRAFCLVAPKDF